MQKIILFVLAAALLLAACGTQPSAQNTAPTTAPVEPAATEQLAAPTTAPTEAPTSTEPPAAAGTPAAEVPAAGGEVVYKIVPGESQLQYEVGETFINQNNRFNLAVGVTPQINGEIKVNLQAPQSSTLGTVTADISQFTSDSDRRDNALRERFIQSAAFPTVTFVPTQVEGLPETYQPGQEIPLKVTGDLTIRDVTRPVTFDVTVKVQENQLNGQAVTTILMSDFGFGPISIAGILNSEDEVKATLTFVARP